MGSRVYRRTLDVPEFLTTLGLGGVVVLRIRCDCHSKRVTESCVQDDVPKRRCLWDTKLPYTTIQ